MEVLETNVAFSRELARLVVANSGLAGQLQ
jgi:hypothetical protein